MSTETPKETPTDEATELDALPRPADYAPQAPKDEGRGMGWQGKLLFVLAVVFTLAALLMPKGEEGFKPGGSVLDAQGRPTKLGEHMTQITLLHFWATWCPPCITEIPALQRLADDFNGKPGFQIMMVAVDDDVEAVGDFVGDRAFAVLHDPDWDVANRYGTEKLPETYLLVDGQKIALRFDGQVVDRFIGATDWDNARIRAMLDDVIRRVAAGERVMSVDL